MSEKKKLDTKALLEKSRSVKQKPQGSLLERKLKNKKNGAKFGKEFQWITGTLPVFLFDKVKCFRILLRLYG